ncbi:hypothetical protein Raf01_93070 [Rugosimonospora africana]|uniref:Uncharacterized protein n=1 Tax=Rugosimonospora africana TaxID=556532 RepID=A0A8J3R185_9ACTN|nr:hypothetical protein Raf01_93070 [Rugosimonospora africana]
MPELLVRLVDDAAVFPPGNAPLPVAVAAHRDHRDAWYARLVGPLVIPASMVGDLIGGAGAGLADRLTSALLPGTEIGLIGDGGIDSLPDAVRALDGGRVVLRQVEVAVARRGEDPQPGLTRLAGLATGWPGVTCFAEIPLSWGLMAALDTVAAARAGGADVWPKFRTGGLAAELFPTPADLAAVICACRDRGLRFKLTAGLHHAVRNTDPGTGFVHHGFLNVLVAAAVAAEGGDTAAVAAVLSGTDPAPLVERAAGILFRPRPLWTGFGSCSIPEPLADLRGYGLL